MVAVGLEGQESSAFLEPSENPPYQVARPGEVLHPLNADQETPVLDQHQRAVLRLASDENRLGKRITCAGTALVLRYERAVLSHGLRSLFSRVEEGDESGDLSAVELVASPHSSCVETMAQERVWYVG